VVVLVIYGRYCVWRHCGCHGSCVRCACYHGYSIHGCAEVIVSVTYACMYRVFMLTPATHSIRCSEPLRLVRRPKLIARTISERLSVALCCCSGNNSDKQSICWLRNLINLLTSVAVGSTTECTLSSRSEQFFLLYLSCNVLDCTFRQTHHVFCFILWLYFAHIYNVHSHYLLLCYHQQWLWAFYAFAFLHLLCCASEFSANKRFNRASLLFFPTGI